MTAKIYYDRLGNLLVGKGVSAHVDLGEIEFHVANTHTSNKHKPNQVFLIMTDNKGMRDIIELEYKRASNDPLYRIYAPSLQQSVRIKDGSTTLQLMELVPGSAEYATSNELSLSLSIEHYEMTRQIYLAEALGARVQGYYTQIVDLFQQLKEHIEKGE